MKLFDVVTGVKAMDADEARAWMESRPDGSYTLLDVREPTEYEAGHIPGALLIPVSQLADRVDEVERSKPVLAY